MIMDYLFQQNHNGSSEDYHLCPLHGDCSIVQTSEYLYYSATTTIKQFERTCVKYKEHSSF